MQSSNQATAGVICKIGTMLDSSANPESRATTLTLQLMSSSSVKTRFANFASLVARFAKSASPVLS